MTGSARHSSRTHWHRRPRIDRRFRSDSRSHFSSRRRLKRPKLRRMFHKSKDYAMYSLEAHVPFDVVRVWCGARRCDSTLQQESRFWIVQRFLVIFDTRNVFVLFFDVFLVPLNGFTSHFRAVKTRQNHFRVPTLPTSDLHESIKTKSFSNAGPAKSSFLNLHVDSVCVCMWMKS